ncbi:helix-turn-helix domain-containing protein [Burkholderia ubonensis]|uniref:helix-turn-helix domain-containing protein n=1 Tax=Burkholderia ubonensis TaxID=101571 RepID=UPI001E5A4BE7|nr:helix-turn-helix transcriptional regulator [Burkholderia ubonensis]
MNSLLFVREVWFTFVNLSMDLWFMNEDIGERLKEERGRLGMNQTQFAAIAGVGKTTQINYESGSRLPDAGYLAALAKVGLDVQYVVTSVRSSVALTPDERELVERFRAAPLQVKSAAIGALTAGASSPTGSKFSIDFGSATIGQNNTVSGGKHKFTVTTPSKKK